MNASQEYATVLKAKWQMLKSCKALMALFLRLPRLICEPKAVGKEFGEDVPDENSGSGILWRLARSYCAGSCSVDKGW